MSFVHVLPDSNFSDVEPGWYNLKLVHLSIDEDSSHVTFYFSIDDSNSRIDGLIATAFLPYKIYVHSKSKLARWLRVLSGNDDVKGTSFYLWDLIDTSVYGRIEHHYSNNAVLLRVVEIE